MGLVLQIVLSILGTLVVIGLIIYYVVMNSKESRIKEIRKNAPRFKNFGRTKFTNGYFEGLLIKELPRKNACHYIEFIPTDVEKKEGKKRPGIQRVVVHENNIARSNRGGVSGETEQVWGIPAHFHEVPKEFEGKAMGEWMKNKSVLAHLEKSFGNRTTETLRTAKTMIENTTETGITRKFLDAEEERRKELMKMFPQVEQKEEDKTKKI